MIEKNEEFLDRYAKTENMKKQILILFILTFYSHLCPCAENTIDLSIYEKKIHSQNGEDGVLKEIFSLIGTTNKYFVEFGVEAGFECNTRNLRENLGWNGLMMDSFNENISINLYKEFITAENINYLFSKYEVPQEFDLLSIDIDYNDFYIWNSLKQYSPRVVIIEYNATFLPDEDKVIPYDPYGMWDVTNFFGASILSLSKLGESKGYTLVYTENSGVNLFFIRNDLLEDVSFTNVGDVIKLYKFPAYGYGPNGGHAQDPYNRAFLTFEEACNRY